MFWSKIFNFTHEQSTLIFKLTSLKKSDRRFYRLNWRSHRSNDNWRFDKIINQRQIRSISRRFRNRIATLLTKTSRDSNLWKSIKRLVATICENLSTFFFSFSRQKSTVICEIKYWISFSMKAKSSSHLITSFLLI